LLRTVSSPSVELGENIRDQAELGDTARRIDAAEE
jgi:hypothetical protein